MGSEEKEGAEGNRARVRWGGGETGVQGIEQILLFELSTGGTSMLLTDEAIEQYAKIAAQASSAA